jgi:hypothetical protein
MAQTAILWPVLVMVGLSYSVWFVLFWQRLEHIKRTPPGPEDFATGAAALRYFEPVELPANNLRNLFEMPVLFYALVPLLLVTQMASQVQIVLAWVYVVLRIVHSLIHVGKGPVARRFLVYLLSCAALLAMWIGFAIDLAMAHLS